MEVYGNRRRSRQSFVQAEPSEVRQILGAPLALTGEGLVLASPDTDELLEPAEFAAAAPEAQPAPALAPEDDPLSPVGDPGSGKLSDTATASSSSCCSACVTYSVSLVAVSSVSEATPAEHGYFRFVAQASCTVGMASSISVPFSKAGSTAATTDYGGEIAGNAVTIHLDPISGAGAKNASFIAVDEDLDERPLETVRVEISENEIIKPNPALRVAEGTVFSGDYTFKYWFQKQDSGLTDRPIEEDTLDISNGQAHYPTRERTFGVQILQKDDNNQDQPQPNVKVKLERARSSTASSDVVIVINEDGVEKEVYTAEATTGNDGIARFTLRAKSAPAEGETQGGFGSVDFHAWVERNGEGKPQHAKDDLKVQVEQ
jgi:hypothetical protein